MIVCLDTNIIIYLVEHNLVWTPKAMARFGASLASGDEIVVCDAARVECLIKPLASGNKGDEARYRAFFSALQFARCWPHRLWCSLIGGNNASGSSDFWRCTAC